MKQSESGMVNSPQLLNFLNSLNFLNPSTLNNWPHELSQQISTFYMVSKKEELPDLPANVNQ